MLSNETIRIVVVFLFLLNVWWSFLIANKNFCCNYKGLVKTSREQACSFCRHCSNQDLRSYSSNENFKFGPRVADTANQIVLPTFLQLECFSYFCFLLGFGSSFYREPIRIESQLDSLRSHCSNEAISTKSHSNCFVDIPPIKMLFYQMLRINGSHYQKMANVQPVTLLVK